MAAPDPRELETRIAELETALRELRARVQTLEKALAARDEHPVDRTVVREKVVYDWQS